MNQVTGHNPYAPPTGGDPALATAVRYADVPWFRKNGLNSIFVGIGFLLFPPLLWATCVIVLTGPVYMDAYDERGQLKTWGPANKVVAVILLTLQIGFLALGLTQ